MSRNDDVNKSFFIAYIIDTNKEAKRNRDINLPEE